MCVKKIEKQKISAGREREKEKGEHKMTLCSLSLQERYTTPRAATGKNKNEKKKKRKKTNKQHIVQWWYLLLLQERACHTRRRREENWHVDIEFRRKRSHCCPLADGHCRCFTSSLLSTPC